MNQETDNDAKEQAKAQYESICQMLEALDVDYDRLEELRDEKQILLAAIKEARTEDELKEAEDDWQDWETEYDLELIELQETADDCENREDAQERLYESPLSVQVRSDWEDPGAELTAYEFEILLCTGGPAVRIRGELDEHMQPDRAWMEFQGWGSPWCQYFDADQAALLAFCSNLSFGE